MKGIRTLLSVLSLSGYSLALLFLNIVPSSQGDRLRSRIINGMWRTGLR